MGHGPHQRHQNGFVTEGQQFTGCPGTRVYGGTHVVVCDKGNLALVWWWWWWWWCARKAQSHLRTCCCFPNSRKHVILRQVIQWWYPQVQVFTFIQFANTKYITFNGMTVSSRSSFLIIKLQNSSVLILLSTEQLEITYQ